MPRAAVKLDDEGEDQAIPGPIPLSRSAKIAAEYLADCIQEDHGTRHGRTALYWNLIGVALQHANNKEPSCPESPSS